MERYAKAGCLPGTAALRDERGNDAGQQIAHTARRHTRIAPRTYRHAAGGISHQATGALEHRYRAIAASEFAHSRKTVLADIRGGAAQQAGRLSRVGRDHRGLRQLTRLVRQQIQTIRIQHQRQTSL